MLMKDLKVKSSITLLFLLLAATSVFFISWKKHDKQILPPVAYVKWMQDPKNGLNIKKEMKDFKFTVQYEPAEYIVANFEKDPYLKTSVLNSQKNKYSDLQYYTLEISCPSAGKDLLTIGIDDQQDYLKRENYYSFDFEHKIYLIDNGRDTLSCALFNYAPNYGIAPHINFSFAFKKNNEELKNGISLSDKTLVIEDEIFGNGILQFNIKRDAINNIPTMLTY